MNHTPSRRLHRNVKLLGWASCLNDIASEMIYPLMPQFLIGVLGGNRFHLGLIEGVADSTASLLKLFAGAWSDRLGSRRRFVIAGYALAALSRPVMSIITAPWHLFLTRLSDRVGKGVRTSPRDALIADSSDPDMRGRAFGFQRSMDHVGAALGPVLATAFLWAWPGQLRTMFALTLIPGLIVVAMLLFGLRETRSAAPSPPAAEPEPPLPRLTWRPLGRRFQLYLVSLVIFTLGNSSDAFLLVRAGELGVPTALLPTLWFVFHVVKSGGNLLGGRLVDAIGPRTPILAGWLIYALVYAAFGYASAAWQVWLFFICYGAFYALSEPAEKTLVADLVGAERRGLAFGWYNFAIGISALPASLLFGGLYQWFGPQVAFGTGAALALAAAAMLMLMPLIHEADTAG